MWVQEYAARTGHPQALPGFIQEDSRLPGARESAPRHPDRTGLCASECRRDKGPPPARAPPFRHSAPPDLSSLPTRAHQFHAHSARTALDGPPSAASWVPAPLSRITRRQWGPQVKGGLRQTWPPRFLFLGGRLCIDLAHTGGTGEYAKFERLTKPGDLTIARDAVELFGSSVVERLRQCQNPACPLLFVDASRPGKRAWCTMRRCGNLDKTARYRTNRRKDSP